MRPNGYAFTPGKFPMIASGESHWRDCLNLVLSRRDVAWLLKQLTNSLDLPGTDRVVVSMCGWLEKEEEGQCPFDEVAQ